MSNKNKGFTLIELLATIVILAIIITIATPLITKTIESVRKKSFEVTASGLIESARLFNATNSEEKEDLIFSFDNGKKGEINTSQKLLFDGSAPTSGFLTAYNDGYYDLNICNDRYCACKGKTSDKIFVIDINDGVCGENEDGSVSNNPITSSLITELQDQINAIADNLGKTIYPIGAIYLSLDNTNPSTLFGGTWVSYAEGRTLVGVGTGTDANSLPKTFAFNQSGGEYTHLLTSNEMPSHTHTGSTNSAGAHTHSIDAFVNYAVEYRGMAVRKVGSGTTTTNSAGAHTHSLTLDSAGGDTAHNIMQPYTTVYMWKRTA